MKVNGNTISRMGMGRNNFLMELSTRESIKMERDMVEGILSFLTNHTTEETLWMARFMVLGFLDGRMAVSSRETGRKINSLMES